MSFFKKLKRGSEGAKLYNRASEKYMRLRNYRVGTTEYRTLLLDALDLCQKAIVLNERDGDAHVLLANVYYLINLDLYPDNENSLILRYGAAVIQHWSSKPMRQYPWTKNSDIGWKMYEGINNTIALTESVGLDTAKNIMNDYKIHHYSDALSPKALNHCTSVLS